ncbi:uncharacterized protein Reph isoform X2 [Planococcus citri]|uniref:uncharacterized protein Reph isoform X2 n=1 Tax=Planococcus citri TaxID=170843 RepID=UPI0031F9A350
MIKYLTERLRQYTLNEEQSNSKVKESDHDSGAESDDQNPTMESEECSSSSSSGGGRSGRRNNHNHHGDMRSPTSSPYFLDSALQSDNDLTYDHHSSEEELEVINSSVVSRRGASGANGGGVSRRSKDVIRCRSVSSVLPEKRKWSDAMDAESAAAAVAAAAAGSELSNLCHRSRVRISSRRQHSSSDENMYATDGLGLDPARSHKFVSGCSSGASSDDETTPAPSGAFAPIAPSTPVNFSRSPPLNAHKPPTLRSLSPPLKMLNCDSTSVDQQQQRSQVISPRYKRHRLTPTQRGQHAHNIQRPCLDFEKMQQMKENAVTTWRHHSNGEHGGELSLYCW